MVFKDDIDKVIGIIFSLFVLSFDFFVMLNLVFRFRVVEILFYWCVNIYRVDIIDNVFNVNFVELSLKI